MDGTEYRPLSGDTLGAPEDVVLSAGQLVPVLYAELRQAARRQRYRVGQHLTLQTTALVSEAYLKLSRSPGFNDRAHFLRSAALAMRHVLVNHARERMAEKRGSGVTPLPLDEDLIETVAGAEDLIEINDALSRLKALNERLAQVVECRFFGGFDERETALALGLTERTVRRDWVKARAWLRREYAVGPSLDGSAGVVGGSPPASSEGSDRGG